MMDDNSARMREKIARNVEALRGTLPDGVQLMAVTKYHNIEETQAVVDAGVKDLGENRVQDLLEKMDQIQGEVNWHLIGHLQTNKVKYVIGKVALIHSVDSFRLLDMIEKESEKAGTVTDILIQFNLALEDTKSGFLAEDFHRVMDELPKYQHIRVRGLMCIGPMMKKNEEIRKIFKQLHNLYDIMKKEFLGGENHIDILSMGMTDDYPIAVEEGSTIVRIGRKIFAD